MIALVVAGAWVGTQRRSIASVEQEIVVLRKHISAAQSSTSTDETGDGEKSSREKTAASKQPLNWKKIAADISAMNGGGGEARSMMRLQRRLQEMEVSELVAALDEIAALDLADEARNGLEEMLIAQLCEKDPEVALNRSLDRLDDNQNGMVWQLSNAFKTWTAKDPANAIAWLDKQIAAGKFETKALDGKSQSRFQFEGGAISLLLSSDPDAAGKRLAALPADQRADVLRGYAFRSVKEEGQAAFADLVRSQLSPDQQGSTLAGIASQLAVSGFDKVSAYLDRIDATPEERKKSVQDAALSRIQQATFRNAVSREDLDSMRKWVTAESPDVVDAVTGKALGRSSNRDRGLKFSDAAALAEEYNIGGGNDEVIASFLENRSTEEEDREAARALAEKIADEKRREKVLSRLK